MKKYNGLKRVLSALLCAVLVLSCVPANLLTVYAGGTDGQSDGLWQAYGENDTITKGAWNTAGYGSYDAILLGYNYTEEVPAGQRVANRPGAANVGYSTEGKVAVKASHYSGELSLYGTTGEAGKNPSSAILYNPNKNAVSQFSAYYLGGMDQTFAGLENVPAVRVDHYDDGAGTVADTNWQRRFFTFTGLDEDTYYLFRFYANNGHPYYSQRTQDDLMFYFVEEDGTVHDPEVLQSCTFAGGVYHTYLVKGNFTLVYDKKVTAPDNSSNPGASANYWSPSGFFFDEVEGTGTSPETPAQTVPMWGQVGKINDEIGGAWEASYGQEQAVLLGWSHANTTNNGVLTGYGAYREANNPDRSSMSRWEAQLHVRSASSIVANISEGVPGGNMGIEATRTDGAGRKIATLDAPAGYTGVIPQYNSYAWQAFETAEAADTYVHTSIKPAVPSTTYRNFFKFTGLEANKDYTFTVYMDTDSFLPTAQPSGKVEFSFWKTDFSALLSPDAVAVTADKFHGGAYISFKVKGDFVMSIDKADRFLAPSAFFFDEYVEPTPDEPENVTAWVVYSENDTTTKGAWNTAGYGAYDAVLLGYNFTGTYATRNSYGRETMQRPHDSANFANYSVSGKVSLGRLAINEYYSYPATDEAGHNPPSEILYNPNTAFTGGVRDVYYNAGTTNGSVAGSTLQASGTDWSRQVYTFTGLEEGEHYLFRIYTNNNINYYYNADVQDDLKIHFVEADGTTHENVECISSHSFDGGVYRTYVVEGNFSLVVDRKLTRADGTANNTRSAQYWGLSGFFFDEYTAPAPEETTAATTAATTAPTTAPTGPVPSETWVVYGGNDTITKGAWNTAGYGAYDAILLGYNFTGTYATRNSYGRETMQRPHDSANFANYSVSGKVSLGRLAINEYYSYPATDEAGHNPPSEILYNPNTAFTGGVRDVYYNAGTTNGSVAGSTLQASGTDWSRQVYTFTGLEEGKHYLLRIYTNNNINYYYNADVQDDLKIHFVEADGTTHENVECISSHSFDGGVYRTYVVEGNFSLVVDKKLTRADGTVNNTRSAQYWGLSGFFFDEYTGPAPEPTTAPPTTAPTTPVLPADLWTISGSVDTTTGSKWRTEGGYGDLQALLFGWTYATEENNGVPADGYTNAYPGQCYPVYRYIPRFDEQLYTTNSEIMLKNMTGHPGNFWAYEGKSVIGEERKATNLEAPENYTGVIPQYNTYALSAFTTENAAESQVSTMLLDVVPAAEGTKYRSYFAFTGMTETDDVTFTIYFDTRNFVDSPSGVVKFTFLNANGTEVLGAYETDASQFPRKGAYISFKVRGNFTVVIDKADRFFGPSAFFFDSYEKPSEDSGNKEEAVVDKTLWQQSGNIDKLTAGNWHSAGYGKQQAILLGWMKADDYNAKTYELDVGNNWRYDRKGFNPGSAAWLRYNGADFISMVTDQTWNTNMGGDWAYYKGCNLMGVPTYKTTLEVPSDFKGTVPVFSTYTSAGKNHDNGAPFQDVQPLGGDFGSRVAMKFILPDEDVEYAFTIYADTKNYKYKLNDEIRFSFLSSDGEELLGSTTLNASEFPRKGGYITFKVKGSFILLLDKDYYDGQFREGSSQQFGLSAFFFDLYEGPKFHAASASDKSLVHYGNLVDTIGGAWRGRFGNVDGLILGYKYSGLDVPDGSDGAKFGTRFILNRDEYDLHLSDKITVITDGDKWFCYGASGKSLLSNPGEEHINTFMAYAAGGFSTESSRIGGESYLPLEKGYVRNMFSFSGMPEGKPYLFTLYAECANNDWFDVNQLGLMTFTFVDPEGEVIYQDTLSSAAFTNGAYVTYVVNGDFTLLIDKQQSLQYFGFNAFFFDEVSENFVYDIRANAGEEKRSVMLTWKEDSPTPGSKVVIERRTADGDWAEIAVLNTNVKKYLDTKRDSGTTYEYRIYTRSGVKCSYITDTVSYTVPSYKKTVMTLDKKLYTCASNEEQMTVSVTLTTADGKPCANVPVYLRLDYATVSQVVPMVHEPEVLTDENGMATFTFNPRYMNDATIYGFSRDEDAREYSHCKSEKVEVFVGETTWVKAPVAYTISEGVTPGDLVSINGFGMRNEQDMSKVQVVYAPHTSADVSEKPVENAVKLALVDVDEETGYYITTRLPADAEPGLYDVWVSNGYGWSEPILLNAPRPLFISEYEVWEGQMIRMSGRCLQASQFGADMDTIVRLTSRNAVYYPELTKVTPYSVNFVIDEGTKLGVYTVEISNDGGLTWVGLTSEQTLTVVEKGDDPLGLGVSWAGHWDWDNKFDVTDYGADGTDIKGDTVAFAAAIRAAGEAGGGVVWIPDGKYYITTLQIPAYVVLMGESTKGTVIAYCGRDRSVNMFSNTTDSRKVGHIGFANFTVTLENDNMRPDFFFWLGHGWDNAVYDPEARSASEFFLYGINLEHSETPPWDGPRSYGTCIVGHERFVIKNCTSKAWAPLNNTQKLTQYEIMENNSFIYESGSFYSSAMYSFVENNYASGHFGEYADYAYTGGRNTHGFTFQALCHMEGNTVENVGTTATGDVSKGVENDGETFMSEPLGAFSNFSYGGVSASTPNTITADLHHGSLSAENPVAYAALFVAIVDGRGLGQTREIESISPADGVITIKGTWDVQPDQTSKFDLIVNSYGSTVYNNVQNNAAKGVYMYGNMTDIVVANVTGTDTEGVYVYTNQNMGIGSRIFLEFNIAIRDNILTGVSGRSQQGNISIGTQRAIKKGEYYACSAFGIEIRNNVLKGDLTVNPEYVDAIGKEQRRTESPRASGIVTSSSDKANTDNKSGDIVSVIIEDNHLIDLKHGITNQIHNKGFVADGNVFTNVEVPYYQDLTFQADPDWVATGLKVLDSKVTKETVDQLAAHYETVDTSRYCAESVAAFEAELAEAKAISASASDEDLLAAARELRSAFAGLDQHLWDTGVITEEPTETKLGEKTYTCSTCGETKVETVSKLVAEGSVLWIVILAVCCVGVVAVAGVTVAKAKKKKTVNEATK